VLHGGRNYAPPCRPGLPTGQASSRVRIAPASIGLWSSDAQKDQSLSRVPASAHQLRARWLVSRAVGALKPALGAPVPPVNLPPKKPQFIKAGLATTVQLPASKTAALPYRRIAPPNPSLESGPSEAGCLARQRAAAILRLPGKAPCLCGPLSSNVRLRMKTVPRSLALIPAVQYFGSIRPLRLQMTPFGRRASAAQSITRRSPRSNESDRQASRRAPASQVALCARNASGYPSAGWKIDTERRRPRSSR
jgi:hypothetical protein